MIKVHDWLFITSKKEKVPLFTIVVLVNSKMLQQIDGWKIGSPFLFVEYGALKGAYLSDCSLYTLEILMHAPKPYFTKATFSHRVDSTIYFLVTLIYYKGISNMQENMPSHNLKVLVVVPLQFKTQNRKRIPFLTTSRRRNLGWTVLVGGDFQGFDWRFLT